MMALREVRELGGYVLLDLEGSLHVHHIRCLPIDLKRRLTLHHQRIIRLLVESVQ